MSTYDLTKIMIDPNTEEPMKNAKGQPLSAWETIVASLKMKTEDGEKLPEDEINFRRKIIKKISSTEDKSAVPLKAKAVTAIKEQARKFFIAGVVMQIFDVFEGEFTQAQLDDI